MAVTEPTESSLGDYDFLDIGSSKGGSIDFAKNQLGGKRGLGVDINPANIEHLRRRGYDCLLGDITEMTFPAKSVRFAVMNHVLEHLPLHKVYKAVHCAKTVATDFIYIRGPYFDSDAYLRRHGLKFYWSDWHGHTCHVTTSLLRAVLRRLQLEDFLILGRTPVNDSLDDSIHPLDSPIDQHQYDPREHPPKPTVGFDPPLHREVVCLVRLRDVPYWNDVVGVHRGCRVISGTLPAA
ncbi:MAG: class I SAM-dependent methyltransferase [Gammaproteobacteria bacterium]|nr:class I SAM-dependent methyltransferase [Gammaproteobacteria bacterium]